MNLEKEIENIILVVSAVIGIAILIYFIGAEYTGFAIFGGELFFDNNSDYTSENINFSDSEMKLIPILITENVTTETDEKYYIDKSIYDKNDVSSLIKFYDNNYLEINGILEFELEDNKKFISNQIVSIYLNGTESDLTLCKAPGLCKNNYTNIMENIHFINHGFYNFTINLEDEKKKLYLEGNISIDYIYMIERNITTETNETLNYDNGFIETSNITINDLNDFNYFFADYNEVNFYFLEDEIWKEMNNGNISILADTRIKAELNSSDSRLYNFSLLYNLKCFEEWMCFNYTECNNGTRARSCNDLNNCGTYLEKPIEIEECNTSESQGNSTNETQISTPTPSSGGGGGGGGSTPKEETRTLETKTEVSKEQEIERVLEQPEDLCNNGIKDSNEEGIDCGGSCKKCMSITTILPYTNYLLFIMLVMIIVTLLDKGKPDENSDS